MTRATDVGVAARVRAQYERHPYPPVSPLALPARRPEVELSAALGAELAGIGGFPARPRVLVAGAGSLEALVVARANPSAEIVVAVDLSASSLRVLRWRAALARVAQPFARTAPIASCEADLYAFRGGPFDAIFLSNVLQHVGDPGALVVHLASMLAPHGVLRLVVYPRESRLWMRAIQAHLRALGLDAATPSPRRRALEAMRALPAPSPLRLSFEVNPESLSDAGVVDAFLHAHDEPASPLLLASYIYRAGLRLVGERQTASSRSAFVAEVDPALASKMTCPWERLTLLDESLELCANPVFWLAHARGREPAPRPPLTPDASARTDTSADPIPVAARLAARLDALDALLAPYGTNADAWVRTLAREVGPRVGPPPEERPLPGLALSDYDPAELRATRG